MSADGASIHASAVVVGDRAVLIRGPSGSGKSRLTFDLILAGRANVIPIATLVGDDRVHLERHSNEVVVKPSAALAGLLEVYGLGIRRVAYAKTAVVGLIVDLAAADATRLPEPGSLSAELFGVALSRIPIAAGHDALAVVIAALVTERAPQRQVVAGDCIGAFR